MNETAFVAFAYSENQVGLYLAEIVQKRRNFVCRNRVAHIIYIKYIKFRKLLV